jgi:hypothetical protein
MAVLGKGVTIVNDEAASFWRCQAPRPRPAGCAAPDAPRLKRIAQTKKPPGIAPGGSTGFVPGMLIRKPN